MPQTITNRLLTAAALVAGLCLPAAAQKYTPEPPPLLSEPCKPTKKKPCPTADPAPAAAPAATTAFPFPGEDQPQDQPKDQPAKPASPASAPAPGSFPFPGEPAPDLPAPDLPAPAPASSSSSSSSSSDPTPDPDKPALNDEGSTGSTRFARRKLAKVRVVAPEDREAEDIEVSRYYLSTGAFQSAYNRAKDAVTTIPDDPAAHLALADAAARLHKPEEAVAEYNACLKLDATDPQIKAANKALNELASAKPAKSLK